MNDLTKTFGLFGHLYSTTSKQPQSVTAKQSRKLAALLLVLLAIELIVLVSASSSLQILAVYGEEKMKQKSVFSRMVWRVAKACSYLEFFEGGLLRAEN